MAKKKSKRKDRKKSKKSSKRRKKKVVIKKKAKTKKGKKKKSKKKKKKKKKKGTKRPKGPPLGPRPVDPTSGRPKKKWPKKKTKKWPPRKKKRPPGSDDPVVEESNLLRFSDFAAHVETFFYLADFEPSIPIELVEVAELDPLDIPVELEDTVRTQTFYIRFLGPVNVEIGQGVYTVEHSSMETMVLLLVAIGPPVSSGDFQIILEAVFA